MQITMEPQNRVLVTVKRKGHPHDFPIWNKVYLSLQGDVTNMLHLIEELKQVKAMVNGDVNRKGFKLSEVDITIEFVKIV